MRNADSGEDKPGGRDIRKLVWEGPFADVTEGHAARAGEYSEHQAFRGAVGITDTGQYKAGQVERNEVRNAEGKVALHVEDWYWNEKPHAIKEHAIFAAREWVAQSVENGRRLRAEFAGEHAAPDRSVAAKYGGNDAPQRELKPPSRSR